MLRVSAIQMNAKEDKKENLDKALKLIDSAVSRGAAVVALPEYFSYMGPDEKKYGESEEIPGPTVQLLAEKARACGIYLLAGSILEREPRKKKCYNTSLLLGPDGSILAGYRKINLFDVEIPGGVLFQESRVILPGSHEVAVDTEHGTWGLTICFDLRFPELFRSLAAKGAWLIFVPSAFSLYTGKDHWEVLLRARAIENYAYLVAPGQLGYHPPRYYTYGNSMVVDPWGTVVSRAPEEEGVIFADLDRSRVERIRSRMPAPQHKSN